MFLLVSVFFSESSLQMCVLRSSSIHTHLNHSIVVANVEMPRKFPLSQLFD
jgi:hypothetical protein